MIHLLNRCIIKKWYRKKWNINSYIEKNNKDFMWKYGHVTVS